ncbi:MAG: DUF1320 domain-containing protein [Bacteroidia bacterium]|nr:DUF1320 domain-containing protein [Bacteroidia bacterium]
MPRFIKETDYAGNIKAEIKHLLTGTTTVASTAQVRAEDTAIATIKEYLGGRYDCNKIFTPMPANALAETRNLHIVKIVLALALFDLYQQTGVKDLPEHRKIAYDDAISWLKDVGRGDIATTLPLWEDDTGQIGEILITSRKPKRHKW